MPDRVRAHAGGAAAAALLVLAGAALGAPPERLLLRTGDVALNKSPSILKARGTAFQKGRRYVLSLDGPLTRDRRDALTQAGAAVEDYLPINAVLAEVSRADLIAISKLPFVTWAGPYSDSWKVDPDLARAAPPFAGADRRAIQASGRRAVVIYLFDGEPLGPVLATILNQPRAEVLDMDRLGPTPAIVAALPGAALARLAADPSVRFVEELPEFLERNNTTRWLVQSTVPDSTPLYAGGLTGLGQIVGIIDTLVSPDHCSFRDDQNPIGPDHRKILAYNAIPGYAVHGTHVAGTVCGDAGLFDDTRGVAYEARFVFNTYPSPSESSTFGRFYLHYSQGAAVHTNSWGTDATNAYNGTCIGIDRLSWEYDDNLVLFAVSDSPVVRNPENAKNCLAVAAAGNWPTPDSFCNGGAGPTNDGRRKPEIMGPGCNILSSYIDNSPPQPDYCATVAQSGTSMACPAVAGAAVLARQYFTDGYYPTGLPVYSHAFVPSGALLKATLINSAIDLTSQPGFPGLLEGWGRVVADHALYFPGDVSTLNVRDVRNNTPAALVAGQGDQYTITIASAAAPLKVTLAFADAPGALNTSFAPVNNLNLVVTSPGGTVYLGNVFSAGVSAQGGSPDAINNVEQVLVPQPLVGAWTVRIQAQAVNVGRQGYAVVATGDLAGPCRSDFNRDGFTDGIDFDLFVQAFESGDPAADFNGDRFVDGIDYDLMAIAVAEGC